MAEDSFPRQNARTRNFNLGLPRLITVADDGSRVAFTRSRAGDDPTHALWVFDVEQARERLVFDPPERLANSEAHLTEEELARRERARERATGVVTYAADPDLRWATFAVGDRLFLADLVEGAARELKPAGAAFDPRPDPSGRRVAYVADRAVHVIDLESGEDRLLAGEDDPDVSWGLAEFVAAEELERLRGYWWSPDGERVVAARVDEGPVPIWHIASPVDPDAAPRAQRYPRAGAANAIVTLSVLDTEGGRVDVDWDVRAFPYLVQVEWGSNGPLTLLVMARDQRTGRVLTADPDTGATTMVREDHDPHWLHIVTGVPAWLPDGRLVFTEDRDDTRRLVFGDDPVTPPGLQVHGVLHVGDGSVIVTASEEPTETHVWRVSSSGEVTRLSETEGVHTAAAGGDVVVMTSATVQDALPITAVYRGDRRVATLESFAEQPCITARPTLFHAGSRELRAALLTPKGEEPHGPLPVLIAPYGGPHFGRVVKSARAFLEDQWFADQGFAVLVADGRGTPGRGAAWERAISRTVANVVLEDQIDALHAAAGRFGFLDLSRVAIHGWSFGGYLAALAVLRRPDVFHAAAAGAPVTDWRLYDSAYTERYLGHPEEEPEAYRRNSLLEDAARLERPLLLVHGLADDNVYVANTLRLSSALTEAGRLHSVLPLSGMTHRPLREDVAENLMLLELRFLRDALGVASDS